METQFKIYAYKDFMSRAHRKSESTRDMWGVSSYASLFLHESKSSPKGGAYSNHLEKVRIHLSRALDKFIKRKSVNSQERELLLKLQSLIDLIESSNGVSSFIDTALELTSKHKY